MTTPTNIATLRGLVATLDERSREFASSLISQFDARGTLSPRQWPWVDTLIERAGEATTKASAPVVSEKIGDLAPLQALFDRARVHLKKPAIVIGLDGIGELRIAEAGPQSRDPGSVNVSINGRTGTWFGKILKDGHFQASRKVPTPPTLIAGMKEFAKDPAAAAAKHGKLTGRCCFCNLHLTDARSTSQGWGPVCADHWGVPWGERPAKGALFLASEATVGEPVNEAELLAGLDGAPVVHTPAPLATAEVSFESFFG